MEYDKTKREIISKRILSELDKLTLEFVKILEKYTDYVIISGYVAILLGRSRGTEDIDIYAKPFLREKFDLFYKELREKNFWCLNAESNDEIFSYLENNTPVRFAKKNTAMPNFEVRYPKNRLGEETFSDTLTVILSGGKLIISSLERQIAFKRYFLKTPKDIEDAAHIEQTFKRNLDYRKIDKLKEFIENNE